MNILIVEDEAITVMFLQKVLIGLGHQVVGVTSQGEKAYELVQNHNPDLIIMDIGLAGTMNGITAAQVIRESYSMPILFASGYNDKETLLEVSQIPNTNFYPKPVEMMRLKEMLNTLCFPEY
jgi:CheY-like chemotaxis protein